MSGSDAGVEELPDPFGDERRGGPRRPRGALPARVRTIDAVHDAGVREEVARGRPHGGGALGEERGRAVERRGGGDRKPRADPSPGLTASNRIGSAVRPGRAGSTNRTRPVDVGCIILLGV